MVHSSPLVSLNSKDLSDIFGSYSDGGYYSLIRVGNSGGYRFNSGQLCKTINCELDWILYINSAAMEKLHVMNYEPRNTLKNPEEFQKSQNVFEEGTISNIAILCLPLFMSLAPVSLIEPQSARITIWYVISTDLLAPIPLIIKAIELIFRSKMISKEKYSTIQLKGVNTSFFTTSKTKCSSIPNPILGKTNLVLAIWIIIASIIAEFLFFRKHKHTQQNEEQEENNSNLKILHTLKSKCLGHFGKIGESLSFFNHF